MAEEPTYKPGDGAAAFHDAAAAQSLRLQEEAAKAGEKGAANDGVFTRGDSIYAETLTMDDIDKESRERLDAAAKAADEPRPPANDGIFARGRVETLTMEDIDKESREAAKEAAKDANG